jgi:aminoglycoside 6'-N-acetyltransferase I
MTYSSIGGDAIVNEASRSNSDRGRSVQPSFKRLGVEDIGLLQNVADDIFDHDVDVAFATRFLSDVQNILIVALDGDRVVAQLAAVVHQHIDAPADLFIENLGVAADWRRRGLARSMIALAFEAGAEQGAMTAWVGTEEDNEAANALYTITGATGGRFMMFSYPTLQCRNDQEAQ